MLALARVELLNDLKIFGMFGDQRVAALARDTVSLHGRPELYQVVRGGQGYEQVTVVRQDTGALGRRTPAVHRQDQIDCAIEQRQPAVGVGHEPCHAGKTPRGVFGGRRREVDADCHRGDTICELPQDLTRPRAKVERDAVR